MLRLAPEPARLTAVRFRAAPVAERIAVPLDAMVALYHRRSGETHLLAQPLPEILLALDAGEADLPTLADRLGVEARPDVLAVLAERVAELEASGLVQAA